MRIWPEKTVDQEFADLGTAGWSGTLNDRQFAYLRNAGYTGGLPDMMFQLRTAPIVEPPAFSPADLFAASEPGFYARVQTSDLWQDVARTTPVTAAGQEVLSWRLRTAGADIYAEQATAGSGPVYQVDGDGAGYLDFNASKWMLTPSIAPGTDKAQFFCTIDTLTNALSFGAVLQTSTNGEATNGALSLIMDQDASGRRPIFVSRGTVSASIVGTRLLPNAGKNVFACQADIAAPSNSIRRNGTTEGSGTATQGTGNFLTFPAYIGARAGTALFYNRRIYGLILRFGPVLTTQQLTDTEAWMASLGNP